MFFSPAKYGILPEVFYDENISSANGVLELTTDLAILIGSILSHRCNRSVARSSGGGVALDPSVARAGRKTTVPGTLVPFSNRSAQRHRLARNL